MKDTDIKIDICIATYMRPELLRSLLHSLEKQIVDDRFGLRVVVVDNDSRKSALKVVDEFKKKTRFEVVYDIEQVQGISYARNRALRHVHAELFAFLDDDETVTENWLTALYNTLVRYDADAVFGPVVSIIPGNAPDWAKEHPSFKRSRKPTGVKLAFGATNNVLIRTAALGEPLQTFNPAYATTGGGDTDFFYRLHLAGKKLVWCNEAVVREYISPDRLTTRWVYRRALRGGQVFSRIFVRRYSLARKIFWTLTKPMQLIAGLLALPVIRVFSYPLYVRLCCRVYAAAGQITGLCGSLFQYNEYDSKKIIPKME